MGLSLNIHLVGSSVGTLVTMLASIRNIYYVLKNLEVVIMILFLAQIGWSWLWLMRNLKIYQI